MSNILKIINKNLSFIYLFFGFCLAGLFGRQLNLFFISFIKTHVGFTIVLFISIVFFISSVFFYKNGNRLASFLFLYCCIIYNFDFWPTALTYTFHFILFFTYHCFFTFTKQFYCRSLVVIKGYLNKFEIKKLILWTILMFIPTLFNSIFIFMAIFNPLLIFTAFKGHFILFFFIGLWLWLVFLFIFNKFNLFSTFLNNLQNFFSRRACLHFLGNNAESKVPNRLGGWVFYLQFFLVSLLQ